MPTPRDKSLYNKVKQQVYREILNIAPIVAE